MKFRDILVERKLFSGKKEDVSPQESNRNLMSDDNRKEVELWDLANIISSLYTYRDGADPIHKDKDAIEALFLEIFTKNFKKISVEDAIWDRKDTSNPPEKLALNTLKYEIDNNVINGSVKFNGKTYKAKTKFKKKTKDTSGMYYEN